MKKVLLAAIIGFGCMAWSHPASAELAPGNVTGTSGNHPTVADASLALRAVIGLAKLRPEQFTAADIMPQSWDGALIGDGQLTIADVTALLRWSVGLNNWHVAEGIRFTSFVKVDWNSFKAPNPSSIDGFGRAFFNGVALMPNGHLITVNIVDDQLRTDVIDCLSGRVLMRLPFAGAVGNLTASPDGSVWSANDLGVFWTPDPDHGTPWGQINMQVKGDWIGVATDTKNNRLVFMGYPPDFYTLPLDNVGAEKAASLSISILDPDCNTTSCPMYFQSITVNAQTGIAFLPGNQDELWPIKGKCVIHTWPKTSDIEIAVTDPTLTMTRGFPPEVPSLAVSNNQLLLAIITSPWSQPGDGGVNGPLVAIDLKTANAVTLNQPSGFRLWSVAADPAGQNAVAVYVRQDPPPDQYETKPIQAFWIAKLEVAQTILSRDHTEALTAQFVQP